MFPNKVVEECNHTATYYFVVKDTAMEIKSYMLQFLTVKKNPQQKNKTTKTHSHKSPNAASTLWESTRFFWQFNSWNKSEKGEHDTYK